MKTHKQINDAIDVIRRHGVVRVKDLVDNNIHPECLRRLCKKGIVMKQGRGIYILADGKYTEHHSFAEVSKWIPSSVVCLVSALRFHNIGTQSPQKVWIALGRRCACPRLKYPPVKVFRFSGQALSEGVEEHKIDGVTVKIYGIAKTVADCFKYRNKIGSDVAVEALRETIRYKKCTSDDLWKYAKICRVWNVIRPYLEAMQ